MGGGPYPSTTASIGGVPNRNVDIPITSVFLVLFFMGAVTHMSIFQLNRRRGHKFIMSGMTFGFCMARVTTCTLRLVWATHQHHLSIAITAQIFVTLGVILLFAINLIFTQRIVRASHPNFGWHRLFSYAFRFLYASIVMFVIILVTATVDSFYTLDKSVKLKDRKLTLVGSTWFTILAFLPIPFVVFGIIIPKKTRVDKFGEGRFRHKIAILLISAAMLTLGAAFRTGVGFMPRPANNPAWYHSRPAFYCFNFVIEFIIVVFYAVIRIDLRFHIPNGARGHGAYSAKGNNAPLQRNESRVLSEEEVFDEIHIHHDLQEYELGAKPFSLSNDLGSKSSLSHMAQIHHVNV